MARTVRDASLETRAARDRLRARGKPYYRFIEEGLHLGYRKPKGRRGARAAAGKWVGRFYVGKQVYEVETIGEADDFSDPDGAKILSYSQAQNKARERRQARATAARTGSLTVAGAMDTYIEWLESEGRSADAVADARYRDAAYIRPKLGDKVVSELTAKDFRHWRDGLLKAWPRAKAKAGEKSKDSAAGAEAGDGNSGEDQRKHRATVNRIWTTLRAALNKALEN